MCSYCVHCLSVRPPTRAGPDRTLVLRSVCLSVCPKLLARFTHCIACDVCAKQAREQASKQAASSKQAILCLLLYDWYVSPIRSGLIRCTDGCIACTCAFVIQPMCTKCRRALMQSNPVRSDKTDGWIHCVELQMSVEFATKIAII